MNDMASVAATVESRVAAAALGDVHPDIVAIQTEIFPLVAGHRLQKQCRIVRLVRVMALQAVVGVGSMDETRNVGGVLILVAREAERCGRWRDQLNSRNLFVCAHFVTTEAVDRSLGVG